MVPPGRSADRAPPAGQDAGPPSARSPSGPFAAPVAAILLALLAGPALGQEVPWPRPIAASAEVAKFTFADGLGGWQALHAVELRAEDGRLIAEATGEDPYFQSPPLDVGGNLRVVVTGEFAIAGPLSCYWSTAAAPAMAEERAVHRAVVAGDGTVELHLGEVVHLRHLRLDPGGGPGRLAIASIRVFDDQLAERWITGVSPAAGSKLRVDVAGGAAVELPVAHADGFAEVVLPAELLATRAAVHLHDRGALQAPQAGELVLRVFPAVSAAAVYRERRLAAVLHPLVMRAGRAVPLKGEPDEAGVWRLAGKGVRLLLEPRGDGLGVSIDADDPIEGPVVRSPGPHVRALLAGVEFLDRGEPSSSDADIETNARFRFVPDPLHVTWPCIAVETGTGTLAFHWEGELQPVFAAPDRYDGMDCARLALRGKRIRALLDCGASDLDDAMLRAVRRLALPEPLPAPGDQAAWLDLCRAAFAGPLRGDGGFGHCAEPNWARQPFADLASAVFRLHGALPDFVQGGRVDLVPGGAHLSDDAAWFVAGQAGRWAAFTRERAAATAKAQREDGTWAYAGPYRRGHYEDTASGPCGAAAVTLLEFARLSGDQQALDAGRRALAAAARFDTPRGAQTWELSLHTPDVLAAAHLVRAHVQAFELTQDRAFLDGARRWAVRGLPFVYLRAAPALPYATIAVFGATNWRAPLWIGLPVQWCGLVYADALARLAPHDETFPWRTVAEGVLRAGQHQQARNGPMVGCLPDSWDLRTRQGHGPWINPGALYSLDRRLRGEPVDLEVLVLPDGRRAVSAWPLAQEGEQLRARAGRERVPVVIDGREVVEVPGDGR